MPKKATKEEFIAKAQAVYGNDRHDYAEFVYANNYTKSVIRCVLHDIKFEQDPANHLKGYNGCARCPGKKGAKRRIDIPDLIERSNNLHQNRYDYSRIGEPKRTKDTIIVHCLTCCEDFRTSFDAHLYHKVGCVCYARLAQSQSNYNKKPLTECNLLTEFPLLAEEFSYKNSMDIESLAPFSHEKVIWICPKGHEYVMGIAHRTKSKQNCPVCAGQQVHEDNNFATNVDAVVQWDYAKNENCPSDYTKASSNVAQFICDCKDDNGMELKHEFSMRICNFHKGERCPYRAGKKCSVATCVAMIFPEIIDYWDFDKNEKDPTEVLYGSGKTYCLKCPDCFLNWQMKPNAIKFGISCPSCRQSGFSAKSIRWLESLGNINIQHGKNGGEFKIPSTNYRADGFDPTTNTVYEFHGAFWHGDPRIYEPNDINPVVGKTFGDLYCSTLKREQIIRELGYNLIIMWETDFIERKK